jgi:hypothetical protein
MIDHDKQAVHNIFAYSRPDKIGIYIRNILKGISAKKSAQILYPAFLIRIIEKGMLSMIAHEKMRKG